MAKLDPAAFERDEPRRPGLRLLVLQPTPFCNIDCSYCYLEGRSSKKRMSFDILELAFKRVFESSLVRDELEVAWHGGEPLTLPVEWYEEAFALVAKLTPPFVRIIHRFQTNGLLLQDDWADFFCQTRAKVGLSIDGPADLHDANRRTRHGQGTHQRAMRAVRLLQNRGLAFSVITVLTDNTLDHPDRLFDFYVENGIREVGFNVEEIEGSHVRSSLQKADAERRYRFFIRRFLNRVWENPTLIRVREFENTLAALLSRERVRDEQNEAFAIISVSYDGKLSTFSPELLGARLLRHGDGAFGNVITHDLMEVEHSPLFQAIKSEIQLGVSACERNCKYFAWCGGGAPANKVFETGRFDATETMHCRLTQQLLLNEIIDKLESVSRPFSGDHGERGKI